MNLKQAAVRVKIDPATKDMRDPDRVHMPSDASCIAKDGVAMVNHEIKISCDRKIKCLQRTSAFSNIVSHIVTVFCYGNGANDKSNWTYLGKVLSEIKDFMIDPRTDTPSLDMMPVHWGSIEALYSLERTDKTNGHGKRGNKERTKGNIRKRVKNGFLETCSVVYLQHAVLFGDLLVSDMGTAVSKVYFK